VQKVIIEETFISEVDELIFIRVQNSQGSPLGACCRRDICEEPHLQHVPSVISKVLAYWTKLECSENLSGQN